jgi:F-type H+-transporting ATPase subunit b
VLIDWFTVIASIVNFLVLVVLLRHFLYRPITRTMEERKQSVKDKILEAEQREREAAEEAERYRKQIQVFEAQREEVLRKVMAEAEAERKEWLKKAQAEVDTLQERWRQTLEEEKDVFYHELHQRLLQETQAIARKILADLASTDLETAIVDAFIHRLQELDRETRQSILDRLEGSSESILIHTSSELNNEARQRVRQAVKEHLTNARDLQFETSPDLICGIELHTPGYKIAWSIENYLANLEDRLDDVLEN